MQKEVPPLRPSPSEDANGGRCCAVAVLGAGSGIPDEMVDRAASDLGAGRVVRGLGQAEATVDPAGNVGPRLVLLDESYLGLLCEEPDELLSRFERDFVALCYEDAGLAARAAARLLARGRLKDVAFVPSEDAEAAHAGLRSLVAGTVLIPAAIVSSPSFNPCGAARGEEDDFADLTPREIEVLALVASGASNKQVAASLGISEHTVKLHMHHIIRKLGCDNRTAASIWYLTRCG